MILTMCYAEEAAARRRDREGVLWVPYLMGERTPHLDPNARAALVGLAASHTRAHVIRAIMEGVAFSLKDTFTIFEEMKIAGDFCAAGRRRGARRIVEAGSGGRVRDAGGNC